MIFKTEEDLDATKAIEAVPLYGRDEMNLVEFPFGPISSSSGKTLDVEHRVFDRFLKREVTRRMIITGSEAFGLPRPIDDQVLIGMKTLTHESGNTSRKVEFSRYHLCRVIGWAPDGRAYHRLEKSFDRIAGTTLKFKDGWWDKGEQEWKSKTFHLVEEVDICSRDRLDRTRAVTGQTAHKLCSFVWSDVMWKSLQDGYIKALDMELFRKIAQGRRRDVPLRLFRILDKRFHFGNVARFDLEKLCIGTLGLSPKYSPSQMLRVLERATKWLIECEFLEEMRHLGPTIGRGVVVVFRRKTVAPRRIPQPKLCLAGARSSTRTERDDSPIVPNQLQTWFVGQGERELFIQETSAIEAGFGSELERKIIADERSKEKPILGSGRIRQEYVRRFVESKKKLAHTQRVPDLALKPNAG